MKLLRPQYLLPLLASGLFLVLPHVTFANSINEAAQRLVFNIVMGILGMFVWLAALILNFAINSFVIGFGDAFANTGIGVAVDNTWVIVRDFVNLGFIFGFVYIGFKMILDASDSNARRWLAQIIIAALLVNFSLFAVKIVIDITNQLAAQIAIAGLGNTSTELSKGGLRQVDVATEFMARMGLSAVFNLSYETINGAGWGYIFGAAFLSLTTMFVFAAGGILLIIRFAVLCLFMVLSPIMFIGWVLPPAGDYMKKFWSMLIGRALFAPVYLLFIYFSLQIISGLQVSVGGETNGFGDPDWAGTFTGAGRLDTDGNAILTLGTFPFFVLAIIFMGASIYIANKIGADGGDRAVGMGKAFANKVRGYTTRVATKPGRMAAGGATRLAGAGAANLEGSLNRRLGRMAQSDSAMARRAARVLDRTAGAGLRNAQNASVAGSESYNARNTRVGQQNARLNELNRQNTRAQNTQDALNTPRPDPTANPADAQRQITDRQDARRRAQNNVRDMSPEEILERARNDREGLMSPEFASLLTDAQVTALENSGLFNNTEMDTLRTNRDEGTFAEITSVLENSNASTDQLNTALEELSRVMSTMSNDRLQGMMRFNGEGELTGPLANNAIASRLTSAHIDTMRQSGQASTAQMREITDTRNAGLVRIAQNGSVAGPRNGAPGPLGAGASDPAFRDRQRRAMFRNAQDAASLPPQVLAAAPDLLTPRVIDEFLRRNPSPADMQMVRDGLRTHLAGTATTPAELTTWQNWNNNPNNVMASRFNLF